MSRRSRKFAEDESDEEEYSLPVKRSKSATYTEETNISTVSNGSAPQPRGEGMGLFCHEDSTNVLDEFEPGAVRKVTLENFVTYDHAVFTFGPCLNMIIGPNGTGKSTVVCAICLGLGGKPEILGRAKQASDFIRTGHTKATITIELQGYKTPTVTVRRVIEGPNSSWQINGKSSSLKEVKALADSYKIMMDNLCQFLPQDKVSKFAEMPANELLLETERAVGSNNLVRDHEELIRLDELQSTLKGEMESNKQRLADLRTRHTEEEAKITRIKERQRTKAEYDMLVKAKPFLQFRELKTVRNTFATKKEMVENEIKLIEEQRGQFIALSDESLAKSGMYREEVNRLNHSIADAAMRIRKTDATAKSAAAELQKDRLKLANVANQRREEERNREELQSKISNLERVLEANPLPDPHEIVLIKERVRQIQEQIRSAEEDFEIPQQKLTNLNYKSRTLQEKRRAQQEKLSRLKNVFALKLANISRMGPLGRDTAAAAEFVLKNKDLFKGEVHLPPVLSLKYKRQDCFAQIAAVINRNAMFTFTCESREDYTTFTRNVIDEQHLNVNVAEHSRTGKVRVADHKVPCTPEKLKHLGLDCFVIEVLEGPEAVLNMLCHKTAIHAIPMSFGVIKSDARRQVVSSVDERNEPLFRRFVDSQTIGNVLKSRYGRKVMSVTESQLNTPPQYFSQGTNDDAVQEVKNTIAEIDAEIVRHREEYEAAEQEKSEKQDALWAIKNQLEEVRKEREQIRTREQTSRKCAAKLEVVREELAKMTETPMDFDLAIKRIQEDIEGHVELLQKVSVKLIKQTKALVELENEMQEKSMQVIVYGNEAQLYSQFCTEQLQQQQSELLRLDREIQSVNAQKVVLKKEVKAARDSCSAEEKDRISDIYNDLEYTLEKLQENTTKLKASLDVSLKGGEESLMARYNKRAEEIEQLEERVRAEATSDERYSEQIAELRKGWEPELQGIVARVSEEFSNAFKLIKCRGEVRLGNTDKGFKHWTMNIMISFRDNAEMQTLNHQRQSGGERALSTVFYLISLQGLTKSPFRVVDEINQGMDRKNERIVHSRIVNVACREGSSQYFLITPKLLTDLEYHEKMKVHCIYSGNCVADTRPLGISPGYLKNLVATMRRLQREEREGGAAEDEDEE